MMLDHTGSTWTTCFNDQGKVVMNGRTADEISELRDTNLALFESTFKEALFKQYVCRLRVKAENVQEELRVKADVSLESGGSHLRARVDELVTSNRRVQQMSNM